MSERRRECSPRKLNATSFSGSGQIREIVVSAKLFLSETSFHEVDSTIGNITAKIQRQRRNYGERLSARYLGLFNQRRKNSRRGEYGLSVSYNQLSVCMNVHMRILCSFTYGCARRRSSAFRVIERSTSVGSAGPTFFHSRSEFTTRRIFPVFHHLPIGFALRLDSAHCDSGTAKSSDKYLLTKYRKFSRNSPDVRILAK